MLQDTGKKADDQRGEELCMSPMAEPTGIHRGWSY